MGYDSDEDEEESGPSTPTPATAAPAATPATAASTEDSFEFLFEEEAPFVSDDEADWEDIDVPDDWMGDPDETRRRRSLDVKRRGANSGLPSVRSDARLPVQR